jgi:hypothetical protein
MQVEGLNPLILKVVIVVVRFTPRERAYSIYFIFINFCVVLYIVCFVSFPVLFVCICVLYYCHRVATQLQLNISYHVCVCEGFVMCGCFW